MAAGNLHERENFRVFTLYFLINNDLFTYEIEVPKPTLCDEQQTSNPTHNDIEEYKWKMSYEECEKIYVEVVIFVNKRLVRLIDVIMEQWLDLKYGNHKTMDENVNKGVIDYENKLKNEDDEPWSEDGVPYEMCDHICEPFRLKNRKANALWVSWMRGDDEVVLSNKEDSNLKEENNNDEHEIAEVFRIKTNLFDYETPLCAKFNEFNYLLKIDPELFTYDI
ncbi:hypothetical protein Tco_1403672 [Tanacetum coccineum]